MCGEKRVFEVGVVKEDEGILKDLCYWERTEVSEWVFTTT